MAEEAKPERPWTHRWTGNKLPERKGQLCRLVPSTFRRGNAVGFGYQHGFPSLIEFQDGTVVSAHRSQTRRIGAARPGRESHPGRR